MTDPAPPSPAFLRRGGDPKVVAHRGGSGLAPENTLPAFERAAALGADAVELDVHLSADGALVVVHDATVDRVSDGRGAIRDHTLAALQRLDAGYAWSEDGGRTHPFRGRGVTFPTLREVCERFPDVGLSVEIKPADPAVVRALVALIDDLRLEERVCVGSFHHAPVRALRVLRPRVATAATRRDVRRFWGLRRVGLGRLHRDAARVFAVPERAGALRVVTPGFVRALHRRGTPVHVWTVDDEAAMRRLLAWGVDGILTARPDRLLALLGRGGGEGASGPGRVAPGAG